MDNLAHALVGAALGRAVAHGRVRQAALIGAVAANAPDWTEFLIGFRGRRIDYYSMHRGITHSLLGAAVEIAALTLVIGLGAMWWARRRGTPAPPPPPHEGGGEGGPQWRWLALCIGATVLSHLIMDWQGSYGLRPFLPWSGRWYYGDWVAIVDPFYWLVPLIALAWGARRHWQPALLYGAIAAFATFVLLSHLTEVAAWVSVAFAGMLLVAAIGWTRHWAGPVESRRASAVAVLLLCLYSAASGLVSHAAKATVERTAVARFGPGARWAALTVTGRPFSWEPIYASADSVAGDDWAVARHLSDPRVQSALQTTDGRAMGQFARFLVAEVDPGPAGTVVVLRDARYARRGRIGWAVVAIRMAGG
jgi:inner membrane protein